ncbi:hypothetical protein ACFLSJ_03395 [Verrucomicrobiota bacterium]
MLTTLVVVGVGAVIWLMGHGLLSHFIRARKPYERRPSRVVRFFGRALHWGGLAVAAVGLYAGLRGPMTIGAFTLERFTFVKTQAAAQKEAVVYVRKHVAVGCRPAQRWRGSSKTSVEYSIHNKGERKVSYILIRHWERKGSGRKKDIKVFGPFPPRRLKRIVVKIPPDGRKLCVKTVPTFPPEQIAAAAF